MNKNCQTVLNTKKGVLLKSQLNVSIFFSDTHTHTQRLTYFHCQSDWTIWRCKTSVPAREWCSGDSIQLELFQLQRWIHSLLFRIHWGSCWLDFTGHRDVFLGVHTRRRPGYVCDHFRRPLLPAAVPVKTFCEVSATGKRVNSTHMQNIAKLHSEHIQTAAEGRVFLHKPCANLVTNEHPEEVTLSERLSPLLSDEVIRLWRKRRKRWWASTASTSRKLSKQRRWDFFPFWCTINMLFAVAAGEKYSRWRMCLKSVLVTIPKQLNLNSRIPVLCEILIIKC